MSSSTARGSSVSAATTLAALLLFAFEPGFSTCGTDTAADAPGRPAGEQERGLADECAPIVGAFAWQLTMGGRPLSTPAAIGDVVHLRHARRRIPTGNDRTAKAGLLVRNMVAVPCMLAYSRERELRCSQNWNSTLVPSLCTALHVLPACTLAADAPRLRRASRSPESFRAHLEQQRRHGDSGDRAQQQQRVDTAAAQHIAHVRRLETLRDLHLTPLGHLAGAQCLPAGLHALPPTPTQSSPPGLRRLAVTADACGYGATSH